MIVQPLGEMTPGEMKDYRDEMARELEAARSTATYLESSLADLDTTISILAAPRPLTPAYTEEQSTEAFLEEFGDDTPDLALDYYLAGFRAGEARGASRALRDFANGFEGARALHGPDAKNLVLTALRKEAEMWADQLNLTTEEI